MLTHAYMPVIPDPPCPTPAAAVTSAPRYLTAISMSHDFALLSCLSQFCCMHISCPTAARVLTHADMAVILISSLPYPPLPLSPLRQGALQLPS